MLVHHSAFCSRWSAHSFFYTRKQEKTKKEKKKKNLHGEKVTAPAAKAEQFTAWKKCGQSFHQQPKASSEGE